VREPEGMRSVRRGKRWSVDIIERCGVEWIDLAQDRDRLKAVLSTVMNVEVQ
jgi:hypothetical protein